MNSAKQFVLDHRGAVSGVVIGLVHVGIFQVLFATDLNGELTITHVVLGSYVYLGIFALGAVPAVWLGRRTYVPFLLINIVYTWILYEEWNLRTAEFVPLPPTPIMMYGLGWILLLPVLYLLGRLETATRRAL